MRLKSLFTFSTSSLFILVSSITFAHTQRQAMAKSSPNTVYPRLANGTWIYDGGAQDYKMPTAGRMAPAIVAFNNALNSGQQRPSQGLNELFTYGNDMECVGNLNSWAPANCNDPSAHLFVFYATASKKASGYDGKINLAAYKNYVTTKGDKRHWYFSPIIDGRIDSLGVAGNYLDGFNQMSQKQAEVFAGKVAAAVCPDNNVDGIQFDLEPFSIPATGANGQTYFYQAIAKDFASSQYGCVNSTHPNGRFFSVFTFSSKVNQQVANIFNQYHNGYVVDSLYDLGPDNENRAGKYNTDPNDYQKYVTKEVKSMIAAANRYGVDFQIGIPAAGSVHEFSYYRKANEKNTAPAGPKVYPPRKAGGSTEPHIAQYQYLQVILSAIKETKLTQNPHYAGTNLWSFEMLEPWMPVVNGIKQLRFYYPNTVMTNSGEAPEGEISLLQGNLPISSSVNSK